MALLKVDKLSVSFMQYTGGLRQQIVQTITDLHLSVNAGEIVAVFGSSGSGKSLLAHAIMGILPDNATMSGTIHFDGRILDQDRALSLRGKEIALVPQSVNYLDPLMRVGAQVRTTAVGEDRASAQRAIFKRYRLNDNVERMFPFQLSGGMARRVLVSTAAISGARLIIADEPTPGMHPDDVTEALNTFRELADNGCAVLFITHDIEAALRIADRIAVFYAGTTVETALAADFAGDGERLRHPYSKALWQALPQNAFVPIPGAQPRPDHLPSGCLFAPRCARVTDACTESRPEMREVRGGSARCIHAS
ncbi:ABC transporter ATP-binding protein [Cohnella herbarum]|uniref:Nickel import system ATP-binding protein NikD n=1 Tax=Cohnella herbarum TaxID=2728023 RepID=A0A7Z2VH98_9BACL|nr:ABC transporter ATP-binding protein [Cohnella herbarum]QJD83011.1 ABC transporter ATP-binding protein [Cohnella herbarum]